MPFLTSKSSKPCRHGLNFLYRPLNLCSSLLNIVADDDKAHPCGGQWWGRVTSLTSLLLLLLLLLLWMRMTSAKWSRIADEVRSAFFVTFSCACARSLIYGSACAYIWCIIILTITVFSHLSRLVTLVSKSVRASVHASVQTPKAPRPLSRDRWNLSCIAHYMGLEQNF